MISIVTIYVALLDEGTPTLRGTDALDLGDGLYKIMATPYYNPDDEVWEFPPGSIVKGERRVNLDKEILLAIEKAG
jgi:hypothetical protein